MKNDTKDKKIKCLIVLGATATGKSAFAVELAKKLAQKEFKDQAGFHQFHPEIISADSRQVYKDLDIGSGKITKEEMQCIPHHLIDVADPIAKNPYTVVNFISDVKVAIQKIEANAKQAHGGQPNRIPLPIICGGTGFYISAFTDGIILPETKPGSELSDEEKGLSAKELYALLTTIDAKRAREIGEHNKVRLMRALELAKSYGGKVPEIKKVPPANLQFLKIGLMYPIEILRERIKTRLITRINAGMVDEVRNLLAQGVSPERLKSFGLEYKYVLEHITSGTSVEELIDVLSHKIWQFARRQMTWFKRDEEILWVDMSVTSEVEKVLGEVERFLK